VKLRNESLLGCDKEPKPRGFVETGWCLEICEPAVFTNKKSQQRQSIGRYGRWQHENMRCTRLARLTQRDHREIKKVVWQDTGFELAVSPNPWTHCKQVRPRS